MLTKAELQECLPYASEASIKKYHEALNAAMREFKIDTPLRTAAFIAQVGHESGSLHYVEEIASGEAYEGRQDLGNIYEGDGVRYKGRGFLQITGRSNYKKFGDLLGMDLISHPELLCFPIPAARSAACFWKEHKLNNYADIGMLGAITKVINGGFNGSKERIAIYSTAKKVLGVKL